MKTLWDQRGRIDEASGTERPKHGNTKGLEWDLVRIMV